MYAFQKPRRALAVIIGLSVFEAWLPITRTSSHSVMLLTPFLFFTQCPRDRSMEEDPRQCDSDDNHTGRLRYVKLDPIHNVRITRS